MMEVVVMQEFKNLYLAIIKSVWQENMGKHMNDLINCFW